MVAHTFQWNYEGSDVKVTGDFDNWTASTSMERDAAGHFIKVVDLPASTKVYYKFVVDGNWCIDGQALKEGEGAHENNYVLTGAHQTTEKSLSGEPTAALPVLGPGATYVNGSSGSTSSPQNASTFVEPPKHIVSTPETTAGSTTAPSVPVAASTHNHYDDSGPSPSDPQAVRNARDNTLAEAYTDAIDHLPTREEVVHEVQHAVEVAGGFLAAGLAAGAAAFGLSNQTSHTETSPITGSSAKASESISVTNTLKSALTSTTAPTSVATKSVESKAAVPSTTQTGSLEQAAVAAATSAATNAYNASGLSGLTGVTAPVSSLSKDGSVGFTGIGTAVNQETGVVGTSKIVQGVNDVKATEETHTAQFPNETAGALLQDHQNGAKVERINDHAVLAEVGIGGAAIGTALVTDKTVSTSDGLAIPAQAAEHLPAERETLTTPAAVPSTGASRPAAVTADSGLAPALSRDSVPVETVATGVIPTREAELVPAPVLQSTQALPKDEVISDPDTLSATAPKSTTVSSAGATAGVAKTTETTTKATLPTATSTNIAAAKTETPVVPTSTSAATPATPAKSTAAMTSPSKAAAQAASKSSTARQSARTQGASESTAATTTTAEDGKKKKGLLRRMKSMFNSKQK